MSCRLLDVAAAQWVQRGPPRAGPPLPRNERRP
jgi:hypothetical protein